MAAAPASLYESISVGHAVGGAAAEQSKRPQQEDRVLLTGAPLLAPASSDNDALIVGVYDGHGGHATAEYLAEHLWSSHLQPALQKYTAPPGGTPVHTMEEKFVVAGLQHIMTDAHLECDRALCHMGPQHYLQGSTAVTAIVLPTTIVVAGVGDSGAVLLRRNATKEMQDEDSPAFLAQTLTVAHKVVEPAELARIRDVAPQCLNWTLSRVSRLNVSRTFGDFQAKGILDVPLAHQPVCPVPHTTCIPRSPDDVFLILGSDGLFDVMQGHNLAAYLTDSSLELTAQEIAAQLATCATRDLDSADNTTVIVVRLDGKHQERDEAAAARQTQTSSPTVAVKDTAGQAQPLPTARLPSSPKKKKMTLSYAQVVAAAAAAGKK